MIYCFYAIMGGFIVDVSESLPSIGTLTLTGSGVRELATRGHHLKLGQKAIMDKSKADLLAKGLVICQIGWLVLQSLARKAVGLPLTLLEVHTMSHVAAAVVLYACWWFKPKDVGEATLVEYVAADKAALRLDIQEMLHQTTIAELKSGHNQWFQLRVKNSHFSELSLKDTNLSMWEIAAPLGGSTAMGVGFASLHMSAHWAASGIYFPTAVEALLWKIAGYFLIGITGLLGLAGFLTILALGKDGSLNELMRFERFRILYTILALPSGPVVVWAISGSRLYLIVESFVSLRRIPLEAYILPDWSSILPHI